MLYCRRLHTIVAMLHGMDEVDFYAFGCIVFMPWLHSFLCLWLLSFLFFMPLVAWFFVFYAFGCIVFFAFGCISFFLFLSLFLRFLPPLSPLPKLKASVIHGDRRESFLKDYPKRHKTFSCSSSSRVCLSVCLSSFFVQQQQQGLSACLSV